MICNAHVRFFIISLLLTLFSYSQTTASLNARRLVKIVQAGRSGAGKLHRALRTSDARNRALSLEIGVNKYSLLHLATSPVSVDFLLASVRKQETEVFIGNKKEGIASGVVKYINIPDAQGRTPLHIAAAQSRHSVITRLLKEEVKSPKDINKTVPAANINACDYLGQVPLHYARKRQAAQILLTEHALVDAQDKKGRTPLHAAAADGCLEVVEELVSRGKARPEIKDQDGRTPLHLAALAGHCKVVCYLSDGCGAHADRCDTCDTKGLSTLHLAAVSNNVDLLSYLSRRIRDVNEVVDSCGQTPLHAAAAAGAMESVKYLVSQGASVLIDRSGRTPLEVASARGHKKIVTYLADLMSKNKIQEPRSYRPRSRAFSLFE